MSRVLDDVQTQANCFKNINKTISRIQDRYPKQGQKLDFASFQDRHSGLTQAQQLREFQKTLVIVQDFIRLDDAADRSKHWRADIQASLDGDGGKACRWASALLSCNRHLTFYMRAKQLLQSME